MTATTEPTTIFQILILARQLSADDQRLLSDLLRDEHELVLPVHATLDEAIALYLADACSLGRAAELAGVTRWDVQERLRERGVPSPAAGGRSAEEVDALAGELEREGIL